MVQGSSRNLASATLSSVDICRARASATWSPTVLPSRTLPRRGMLPLTNSSASISVVLPDRYGPTRATQRWPAALGIGISIHPGAAVTIQRLALSGPDGGERPERRQSEFGSAACGALPALRREDHGPVGNADFAGLVANWNAEPLRCLGNREDRSQFGLVAGVREGAGRQFRQLDGQLVTPDFRPGQARTRKQRPQFAEAQRPRVRRIAQFLDAVVGGGLGRVLRGISIDDNNPPPGVQTRTISRNAASGSSR